MRRLPVYALVLLLEGSGLFRGETAGQKKLEPGDVFCVVPNLAHQYGPVPGTLWSEVFVTFSGSAFDRWYEMGTLTPGKVVHEKWDLPSLRASFMGLVRREIKDQHDALEAAAALHLLICDLFGSRSSHPESRTTRLLESKHRIDTWPADVRVDWEEIAGEAGYSYDAWRRAFREHFDESPGRYRTRVLMSRAAALLSRTDMTTEEIAARLGLVDASHLTRLFSARFGETPGQFRRKGRDA